MEKLLAVITIVVLIILYGKVSEWGNIEPHPQFQVYENPTVRLAKTEELGSKVESLNDKETPRMLPNPTFIKQLQGIGDIVKANRLSISSENELKDMVNPGLPNAKRHKAPHVAHKNQIELETGKF